MLSVSEIVAVACLDTRQRHNSPQVGWLCDEVATYFETRESSSVDLHDPRVWASIPMAPAGYEALGLPAERGREFPYGDESESGGGEEAAAAEAAEAAAEAAAAEAAAAATDGRTRAPPPATPPPREARSQL